MLKNYLVPDLWNELIVTLRYLEFLLLEYKFPLESGCVDHLFLVVNALTEYAL